MTNRFIKLIPGKDIDHLQEHHTYAYLLHTFLARKVRIFPDQELELDCGEIYFSDYKKCGIKTRKGYRIALDKLVELGYVSIEESYKNKKIGNIRRAIKGKKLKFLDSTNYELNLSYEGHQNEKKAINGAINGAINFLSVNEEKGPSKGPSLGPTFIKKEEKKEIKECVRERSASASHTHTEIVKKFFRDHVQLTDDEHNFLLSDVGKETLDQLMDILNAHKGATGRKYESDFHVLGIGGWVRDNLEKRKLKSSTKTYETNLGKALKKFSNGEISNNWECFIEDNRISFVILQGHEQPYSLNFNESGFDEKLQSILFKINWKIQKVAFN